MWYFLVNTPKEGLSVSRLVTDYEGKSEQWGHLKHRLAPGTWFSEQPRKRGLWDSTAHASWVSLARGLLQNVREPELHAGYREHHLPAG